MDHARATSASRRICDLIVSRVESEVGDVSAKHAKNVCSLGKPAKFAYVYHRRGGVKIYLQCPESDGAQLSSLKGALDVKKRATMRSDWAKLTPYYIEVDTLDKVADSIPLLVFTAHVRVPAKINKTFLMPSGSDVLDSLKGGRVTVQVSRYERDQVLLESAALSSLVPLAVFAASIFKGSME